MTPSDKDKQDSRNRPGGRGIDPASGPIIDHKANRVSDAPPDSPRHWWDRWAVHVYQPGT